MLVYIFIFNIRTEISTMYLLSECAYVLKFLTRLLLASPPVHFSCRFLKGYCSSGRSVTLPVDMFRGSMTSSPLSLSSSCANT